MIVLLIAELTCGILLLVYPNKAETFLKDTMKDAFKRYDQDPTAERSIDAIQSDVSFKFTVFRVWFKLNINFLNICETKIGKSELFSR